jgi:SAM-dependent methyltransferase
MTHLNKDFIANIATYYSSKLAEHGESPRGVDWNGEGGQTLRFEQLSRVFNMDGGFSINDLGCGYGALFDYLRENYNDFSYLGVDISADMITAGQSRYKGVPNTRFLISNEPDLEADFGIASGIFNVRLEKSDDEWLSYIKSMLDILDRKSLKGFAFNCLTSYSDEEKKRDYLYYADPCMFFDFCKQNYSKNVALLHDYGLYEFTIVVRKSL